MQACAAALQNAPVLITLKAVDKVRLGRALGYGTRHLGKTIAAVAEASTAPGRPAQQPAEHVSAEPVRHISPAAPLRPSSGGRQRGQTRGHLKRSFWQPLATYSSALWLRVTGTFFALIASTMLTAAWRLRGTLHTPAGPVAAHHLWLFTFFGILFGYFAVSSFVRASRRERGARG